MRIKKFLIGTLKIIAVDARLFTVLMLILACYTSSGHGKYMSFYLFVLSMSVWMNIKLMHILHQYIQYITPYLSKWIEKDKDKKLWFDDWVKELSESFKKDKV